MIEKPRLPPISIIILNWNTKELTAECIASVQHTCADLEIEIIVWDNGSTDGSQAMLGQQDGIHLVSNEENVGFAKGNNQAVALCRYEFVLLLNSDTLVYEGALQAMLELITKMPSIGLVGAQLLNPDGSFQASYTKFPNQRQEFLILSGIGRKIFNRWYPSQGPNEEMGPQIVDYVEGACMLLRKKAYEQVSGLDENYFMYAEEVDLCYTLKHSGWQVWYHPGARILHYGGASSLHRRTQREGDLYRSRVLFFRKHFGVFSAFALKAQIYTFTFVKIIGYRILRGVTGGEHGRKVISIGELRNKLRGL